MSGKISTYSKNQSEVSNYSSQIWRMYIQVGFVGLIIVATLWYIMNSNSLITNQYTPLVEASMKIKYETAIAHLWFEEIISGDRHEDINKVWHHIDQAEWFTQAMLEGGQREGVNYIPYRDSTLRQTVIRALESIRTFRDIAKERYDNQGKSFIGSDIDQRFDAVFNSFQIDVNEVESALQQVMRRDIKRVKVVQSSLIIVCFVLTTIIALILHRFQLQQSINLEKLRASNQQLRAGEQQLKATNQQLRAGEQQLKAANQQLRATEQQLRASNQQLKANAQQLKAANQQLTASEQQLKATNQQLMASEQQLRASNLQLLQSQQKLRLHVQHTPLAVIQWNTEFKVTEWNNAAEKIFGFTSEEALGLHAAGLIVPESAKEIVDQVWQGLLDQKSGGRSTNENNTKDNRIIICDWYNTPLIDEDGQTIGVASLVLDITDRKKAEETNRDLAHIMEDSLNEIYIFDAETFKFIQVNRGACKNIGYSNTELIDLTPLDIKPGFTENLFNELVEPLRKGDKEIIQFETVHQRKDSSLYNVEVHLQLSQFNGRSAFVAIIMDITERKKADEALRISEQKLRTYISSAPDAIFIVNASGRYVEVNKAALEMTGYTESELTSLSIPDIVDPENKDDAMMNFDELLKTGKSSTELKLKRKDGTLCWVSLDAVTLADNRLMAFCSDITETKRLQELESRAERLETAGTIAGQVAHDFNNLLGPLMAYPEFIRDELPKNHPTLEYLDQIETAAHKIANINQDLLAMGRRGHYNQVALNLNTIVQQALSELKPLPKALICETDLNSELMDILGGGAQLHRMISNLLHNAKDAMQEIGQITVRTENYYVDDVSVIYGRVPKGEYIKLTISDTGCGIPDNIIQKIFDPFFTSKTTDKKRGSGLGMSVVDAVVKDHHGYIDMATKVGVGTSFYIYFPITRQSSDHPDLDDIKGGSETILVVDDDDVQRQVSSRLLSKLGYEVRTSDSGEEAVKFLRDNPRDLVILDMVMPGGIDGTETFRQILEIIPRQKAIILSGYSESARVLEAQKLGAGAFIKKPITKKDIAAVVRTELDRPEKQTAQ